MQGVEEEEAEEVRYTLCGMDGELRPCHTMDYNLFIKSQPASMQLTLGPCVVQFCSRGPQTYSRRTRFLPRALELLDQFLKQRLQFPLEIRMAQE